MALMAGSLGIRYYLKLIDSTFEYYNQFTIRYTSDSNQLIRAADQLSDFYTMGEYLL